MFAGAGTGVGADAGAGGAGAALPGAALDAASDDAWRVKVYKLGASGEWQDVGSGRLTYAATRDAAGEALAVAVRADGAASTAQAALLAVGLSGDDARCSATLPSTV